MDSNFLNLTELEKEKPIYRVAGIEDIMKLFQNKTNALKNPKEWGDPFENFIMNSTGIRNTGELFEIGFRDDFYGQCWTRVRENDAMWRIYAPDGNGVKIKSTPRKLLESLWHSENGNQEFNCFIGKVKYHSTKDLKKILEEHAPDWILDQSGIGHFKSLLFKRWPFRHEKEVRLILRRKGEQNTLVTYHIDPFYLIDDIVFDPRFDYDEYKGYKKEIQDLGFHKRIVKSNLYKPPNFTFKMNV